MMLKHPKKTPPHVEISVEVSVQKLRVRGSQWNLHPTLASSGGCLFSTPGIRYFSQSQAAELGHT